ncbi:hypothetical protein MTY_0093 [Moorella thermoacetica Y72]|uniref:Uncharacterized protein n=1 Tax=Moorella thermoacetica Y72 TaxID=1325331 RepID=A0A0S6U9B5_NEOTH|nr:hypothetical protein [Moorella thermoacetica]GAF24765.1 hypothetical protein MTY_0093 [Moorella thermoacetica Y72]
MASKKVKYAFAILLKNYRSNCMAEKLQVYQTGLPGFLSLIIGKKYFAEAGIFPLVAK